MRRDRYFLIMKFIHYAVNNKIKCIIMYKCNINRPNFEPNSCLLPLLGSMTPSSLLYLTIINCR